MKVLSYFLVLIVAVCAALNVSATPLLDGRIIGGEDASILDYPYQVGVEYSGNLRCGGAIIARRWILTAAHCVYGLPVDFQVRVGTSYVGFGGDLINVINVVINDEFSNTTFDTDIALLELEDPITLSRQAQIIALPFENVEIPEGTLTNVTGWGYTSEQGPPASVLQVAEIPIMSLSVCRDLFPGNLVSDRMICAGTMAGGIDACTGDGGGPLVINSVLTGLVSWSVSCAQPHSPGVYTNVASLRDWITVMTGI